MKIKFKLLLTFLFTSLIPIMIISAISIIFIQKILTKSIKTSYLNLTIEKASAIDSIIDALIHETKIIAKMPEVKKTIMIANQSYAGKSNLEIKDNIEKIDREWTQSNKTNPIAHQILNNKISQILKNLHRDHEDLFGELILTDIKGATIGMTKILTDYYQADEEWWTVSYNRGKGGIFIDDRGYDKSTKKFALGICIPVTNDKKVIGILKINYNVLNILKIVSRHNLGKDNEILLVRSQGSIIAHTTIIKNNELTHLDPIILKNKSSDWNETYIKGQKYLLAFAQINKNLFFREQSHISGSEKPKETWVSTKWFLIIMEKKSLAFKAISHLRNLLLVISIIILALIIIISIIINKSIVDPIKILQEGAIEIGKGNFDHKINISKKNEFGKLANIFSKMTENIKQLIKKDNELAKKIIISEQEKKKLEEMSKLKSQIVANVSHELRTPLTSIKESFSIVHDGFVGEITKEQKEILETGIRNTKRLIRMVSNLLDVSRIESGKIKVTKKTFELFSFINDLIQTQVKDALKKEITIQKNIFENIGSITTDRDLLSEIFLNILNNAIKYSPPKSEVIINIEEINNEFRFEIADNGAGISKEDLEKIFTRYERLTSTKEEGTGLGLSITKQLINLLHGKIRVESEIGKGSKFIFTLPKNID